MGFGSRVEDRLDGQIEINDLLGDGGWTMEGIRCGWNKCLWVIVSIFKSFEIDMETVTLGICRCRYT